MRSYSTVAFFNQIKSPLIWCGLKSADKGSCCSWHAGDPVYLRERSPEQCGRVTEPPTLIGGALYIVNGGTVYTQETMTKHKNMTTVFLSPAPKSHEDIKAWTESKAHSRTISRSLKQKQDVQTLITYFMVALTY